MAIVALIGHVALRRTSFGRKVLATGGSEAAARYSGVDTRGIKLRVLLLSALAASVAGMLYAGRLHSDAFSWAKAMSFQSLRRPFSVARASLVAVAR